MDEVYNVSSRVVVGGLLTAGVIAEGATLLLGPDDQCGFVPVTVVGVHRNKVTFLDLFIFFFIEALFFL